MGAQIHSGRHGWDGSRRAYINMLDVFAQILAIVTLGPGLNPEWMAFIDNSAGQWAGTGVTRSSHQWDPV